MTALKLVSFIFLVHCSKCLPEHVHTFLTKEGSPIADLYVCYTNKPILDALAITTIIDGQIDTLYRIESGRLIGSDGIEAEIDEKKFKGYKIEMMKRDYLVLVLVDDSGRGVSDFITISWNSSKSSFELIKSP